MPLFQEKAAALKQLSAAYWWGFRSMRRRRPPPLLCGSTPQIFSRASSFDRIGCCRFPRYSFYFSSDAASRVQIASSSGDDYEQKPTAGASLSSSEVHLFQLVRPHVVEILMGLLRKLTFWRLEEEPVRAAATCEAIVRVLCSPGLKKKSIPQSSEIRSSDKDSGIDVLAMLGFLPVRRMVHSQIRIMLDSVITAYLKIKMPDRAVHTFFLACARGYVPDSTTCDVMIDLLVGRGYTEWVEHVYSRIKRRKVLVGTGYHFHFEIDKLCREGEFSKVLGLLNKRIQEGTVPRYSILSKLVRGLCDCGRPYSGYLVLVKSVSILGVSATTIDYSLVISGFCKMGKLCEAELVLEDMVKQGAPPDLKTYASLIGGYCCSSGNIPRVLSLIDQMDTRGIKTNSAIRGSVLHCFSELGKNDAQVLEFFKKYKKSGEIGEIIDKVLYNIAIDAQCKLGKMEEAVNLFQEMKEHGLVPHKIHYNTLISGYCRQGEIDNTGKTLSCMTDVGLKPDVVTYNVLASAFAQSGFVKETLGLFYHMLDHGVEPNPDTYANVIQGFCRGR